MQRACPRQAEELFIAGRVTFAHRRKGMVFVAKKHHLAKMDLRMRFHLRYPPNHRALKVDLHHRSDQTRQAGIVRYRKVEGHDATLFDQFPERR